MTRLSRFTPAALALGSGVLVALSLPPWGWWPLGFAGLALFDIALGATPTRWTRFRRGALFGAGWMFIGLGWMTQLTAPGYVVAGVIYGCAHGAAASLAATGRWRAITRPLAHTLVEVVRFSFPFGGVPLASMAIAQVGGPLAGVARIGGAIGLTWLTFQLGMALPTAVAAWRGRRDAVRPAQVAGVGTAVVIALAIVAPQGAPTGATLSVAAVQGGGKQGTSALEVPSRLVTARHVEATASIPTDVGVDVVLWPENTVDVNRRPFLGSDEYALIVDQASRLGVPLLVGITEDEFDDDGVSTNRYTNAQVVVMPDGAITDRYDKVRRVPFGEYVPLRGLLEKITSEVDRVGEAVPGGPKQAYLDVPDGPRLSTVISWEIFFGGRVREGVREGATAIFNPTNGASYTGTIVQTQQVASSRLRAIETGRWVVQTAPTGFSAIVDEDGTVLQRTALREQRVLYADVELRDGLTWYARLGDRPIIALLVLAALAGTWAARRSGRSGLDDEGDGTVVDQADAHLGAEPSGGDDDARSGSVSVGGE